MDKFEAERARARKENEDVAQHFETLNSQGDRVLGLLTPISKRTGVPLEKLHGGRIVLRLERGRIEIRPDTQRVGECFRVLMQYDRNRADISQFSPEEVLFGELEEAIGRRLGRVYDHEVKLREKRRALEQAKKKFEARHEAELRQNALKVRIWDIATIWVPILFVMVTVVSCVR